jgi:hypothetical protein
MTGLMIGLAICLTTVTLACLVGLMFLIWWTMDSSGRHSISARKMQLEAMSVMKETIAQASKNLELQMQLTEVLLLGRPVMEIPELQPTASEPETSWTPEELWQQLPDQIKETMQREHDEAGAWPLQSEPLQDPFDEDQSLPSLESLTQSLSLT